MAPPDLLIRNPAVPVEFNGLRSDTHTLYRRGWQMTVERDDHHFRDDLRVFFAYGTRERAIRMAGVLQESGRFLRQWAVERMSQPVGGIVIQHLSSAEIHFNLMGHIAPDFYAVSMVPEVVSGPCDPFEPAFQALGAPARKELIIDTPTVADLYQQIIDLQTPRQDEIRKRRMSQAPRVEAQILTFG